MVKGTKMDAKTDSMEKEVSALREDMGNVKLEVREIRASLDKVLELLMTQDKGKEKVGDTSKEKEGEGSHTRDRGCFDDCSSGKYDYKYRRGQQQQRASMVHVSFYRNRGKTFKKPRRPYEKERLDAELRLVREYGLRCKRELWRVQYPLSRIQNAVTKAAGGDAGEKKTDDKNNTLLHRTSLVLDRNSMGCTLREKHIRSNQRT